MGASSSSLLQIAGDDHTSSAELTNLLEPLVIRPDIGLTLQSIRFGACVYIHVNCTILYFQLHY